ncbi:hypothetical protein BASA81_010998 [Batrachochytrium salamandrivorans]|nr:hypothetical protein BASA81_010998 [Batrachochytrium salamandrivorans]
MKVLSPIHLNASAPVPAPKAAKLVPFLKKLQDLSKQCPFEIAHWSCDGKQFDILLPLEFSTEVLKEHFPSSNTKTFFRQLFYYGFTQLNIMNGGGDERTKGTFSIRHPSFLRDSPSRIFEIKRCAKAGSTSLKDENGEAGEDNRVDLLEQKLCALQSIVDDLSRKLAVLQVGSMPPSPPPAYAFTPYAPTAPVYKKNSRKRMHQEEDDEEVVEVEEDEEQEESLARLGSFGEDFSRLGKTELFSLFTQELEEVFPDESGEGPLLAPATSPAPLPVTTAGTGALSTQKLLQALSTVAACGKQVRAAETGERIKISSQQDLPMMSV